MSEQQKLRKATQHLWTFTISKLISTFGSSVYTFGMSFYILTLTGSATSFAANLISSILPRTIAAPFAGYFADKYSKKTIVIVSQIVSAVTMALLIIVAMTKGISLPAIYATTVILSLASSFTSITFTSSIANLVDEGRMQKAMSFNQMAMSIATIGGPAVGGFMYGFVSLELFLVIHFVSYILAVILESTMNFKLFTKLEEEKQQSEKESMLTNMKEGIVYIRKSDTLSTIVLIALVLNFLMSAFQVGFSFMLIEQLKVKSQHFGFAEGAISVGMLIMSLILATRKPFQFPMRAIKWGIFTNSIFFGAVTIPFFIEFSYVGVVVYYISLMFLTGMLFAFVNTPIGVLLQGIIDEEYKGRVFGLIETMAMALMPLGMVIFGYLFDVIPSEVIMLVCTALLILTVLILLRPSIIRKAHPNI